MKMANIYDMHIGALGIGRRFHVQAYLFWGMVYPTNCTHSFEEHRTTYTYVTLELVSCDFPGKFGSHRRRLMILYDTPLST